MIIAIAVFTGALFLVAFILKRGNPHALLLQKV